MPGSLNIRDTHCSPPLLCRWGRMVAAGKHNELMMRGRGQLLVEFEVSLWLLSAQTLTLEISTLGSGQC